MKLVLEGKLPGFRMLGEGFFERDPDIVREVAASLLRRGMRIVLFRSARVAAYC